MLIELLRCRYGIKAGKQTAAEKAAEADYREESKAAEREGLADGSHLSNFGQAQMHKAKAVPPRDAVVEGDSARALALALYIAPALSLAITSALALCPQVSPTGV